MAKKLKRKKPAPSLTIKSVKSKNYTPAYEARLIRNIRKARKSGKKPTRQLARGHKKAEHIERQQKEKAAHGVTSSQIKSIQSFINRFNEHGHKDIPDEETLVDYVRKYGYERFVQYRKVWDAARKKYLSELNDRTWASRGWEYLTHLTGMASVHPTGDEKWLYYH